jgi:hypothetical protein
LDVKLELGKHPMRPARLLAHEIMEDDPLEKAGERSRPGGEPGERAHRPGESSRPPVEVQRLIDNEAGETFSPESYQAMRERPASDKQLQEAILLGLSHRATTSARGWRDDRGIRAEPAWTVSRRFQERAAKALEAFENPVA